MTDKMSNRQLIDRIKHDITQLRERGNIQRSVGLMEIGCDKFHGELLDLEALQGEIEGEMDRGEPV